MDDKKLLDDTKVLHVTAAPKKGTGSMEFSIRLGVASVVEVNEGKLIGRDEEGQPILGPTKRRRPTTYSFSKSLFFQAPLHPKVRGQIRLGIRNNKQSGTFEQDGWEFSWRLTDATI